MELFISEIVHVVVSLVVGLLLYYKYRKCSLIFLALAVGLFIDFDHIIDYVLYVGITNFSLTEFLQVRFFNESGKIYNVLHGWEWGAALLVLAYFWKKQRPVILTIALAMLTHIMTDQLTIAYYAGGHFIAGYSFIFRLINNFNAHAFIYNIF